MIHDAILMYMYAYTMYAYNARGNELPALTKTTLSRLQAPEVSHIESL